MRASQKYFELQIRGIPRPKCPCHGETMHWSKRDDYRAGGRFECSVKQRAASRRYEERKRKKATAPDDDREPPELIYIVLPDHGLVCIPTSPEVLALVLENVRV